MNQKVNQQFKSSLQTKLGYTFKQPAWLQQALTHRSAHSQNYERLEFVGDAILDYVITLMLFEAFPNLPEGRLSVLRTHLVKEATLAEVARELGLGKALILGVGELKSGGYDRASILADALEAIFAAIRFDADLPTAERVIRQLFAERVQQIQVQQPDKDHKTRLQEALQAHRLPTPKYRIERQTGEGSDSHFDVSCDLGELGHITYASGSSRRAAEQECAKQALQWLNEQQAKSTQFNKRR
ncbi:ribonuclease III [Kingella kingae]|uniref:ribonuclease III n=1 Tax=Kingella kingae TaxID=504 RepID=UPI0002585FDF|nr:ribonuclease III [Kingella kingae]EIC13696.1 ribonuclease III [Kingella kingae PYKK081]MBD3614083.1 ribonuclease III [Kingella kingae]MBD3632336.1 ribonuclease III [Kingella kingae]MBD3659729.1 ribonuclease III [Kingella kingae]MDK4525612.1 ribonuclease III [Kingella kingae]